MTTLEALMDSRTLEALERGLEGVEIARLMSDRQLRPAALRARCTAEQVRFGLEVLAKMVRLAVDHQRALVPAAAQSRMYQ